MAPAARILRTAASARGEWADGSGVGDDVAAIDGADRLVVVQRAAEVEVIPLDGAEDLAAAARMARGMRLCSLAISAKL